MVLTFEPHPLKVLAPRLDLKFLMGFEERMRWIGTTGIQLVRCISFTREFAELTPLEFARKVLRDDLGAREVWVGNRFAFGKDRKGTVQDLQAMGRDLGFETFPMEPVLLGGEVVSSSRIRECLLAGQVTQAGELLGRSYSLEGRIIRGEGRGRALGYPTANIQLPQERVIPSNGVYAVRARIEGEDLAGVAYIGIQPTLGPHERMLETHLFEYQADLYDRSIRVSFVKWIRSEMKFADRAELVRQIEKDIRRTRKILAGGQKS